MDKLPAGSLTPKDIVLFVSRLLVLIFVPLIFVGAWHIAPTLFETASLLSLSGILSLVWALQLAFLQKLTLASMGDGLTSKEQERLDNRLVILRKRVWQCGGICLSCFLTMWLLTAFDLPKRIPEYAAAAGFLIGVGISYLIQTASIYQESAQFMDEVKRRDNLTKRRAEVEKTMSSNSGKVK